MKSNAMNSMIRCGSSKFIKLLDTNLNGISKEHHKILDYHFEKLQNPHLTADYFI